MRQTFETNASEIEQHVVFRGVPKERRRMVLYVWFQVEGVTEAGVSVVW